MGKFIDITGQQFGNWKVLLYDKNTRKWVCECQCNAKTKKLIASADLRKGKTTNCGCLRKKDLTGKEYKHLIVDSYAGDYHWNCHCKVCNKQFIVHTYHLEHDNIPACTHNELHVNVEDITGQKFGEWEVLSYAGKKYWNCRCSCGVERKVIGKDLRSGRSKSCGHDGPAFKDITGQKFGEWTAIKYNGDSYWECRCSCGTLKEVLRSSLIRGESKSCGCMSNKISHDTLISRYGDMQARINKPRKDWQIASLDSKENFIEIIKKFNKKPTVLELTDLLDCNKNTLLRRVHKWEIENLIDLYDYSKSNMEKEIFNYIRSLYKSRIIQSDRKILKGKELDIYIPEKKLAIEFNGTYWHCDEFINSYYHQNKTIECIKQGIQLIHIFEYEWINDNKQKLIKQLLIDKLCESKVYYARQLKIGDVTQENEVKFLNEYHIQGYTNSSTAIGLYDNNELLGIMTFGKPRFNNNYDCELIRMCFKTGISIVGGAERILKHYIDNYKPKNIISYCDLAKFNGNSYLRLGFHTNKSMLTQPNYVWVSPDKKEVLPRYQTQKQKLINLGLDKYGDTETEIMKNLDYLRVYDAGNMKFEWNSDTTDK